jgi:hypothetical protein
MKSRLSVAASTILALTAGAVIFAPVAAANGDGQFIEQLALTDATLPGKTPEEMVAAGYATCAHLRGGVPVLDEMSAVETTYQFNQGTLFVSAATTNLCPDFAG